jgi:hypothetical protein
MGTSFAADVAHYHDKLLAEQMGVTPWSDQFYLLKEIYAAGKFTELEKVIYGFASDRQSERSVETKDRDSK